MVSSLVQISRGIGVKYINRCEKARSAKFYDLFLLIKWNTRNLQIVNNSTIGLFRNLEVVLKLHRILYLN